MSARGLDFIREWTENNIDLNLQYRAGEVRAHVLAAACRMDARAARVGLQENEDEVGKLEDAIARLLETRGQVL
jgi:hypothetical protein